MALIRIRNLADNAINTTKLGASSKGTDKPNPSTIVRLQLHRQDGCLSILCEWLALLYSLYMQVGIVVLDVVGNPIPSCPIMV